MIFNFIKSICISLCKFSVYFARKNLLFLFYISTFTKHSHQFIYSTHLFNKIFFFFTFFIISFPLLSGTNLPHRLLHPHPHPASNPSTKSSHWFTDLPQQQSQQQRHNHNHNNFDPLALHVRSILRHLLRFHTDCWIGEADRHSQLTRRPNSSIELSPWCARSPPKKKEKLIDFVNERELRWEKERAVMRVRERRN